MNRFKRYRPLSEHQLSKKRILLGVIFGVICSLLLYLWQQYLFVLLKFDSDSFGYNVDFVLSRNNLRQLSLYFAGNALIIGNSIAIGFITHFRHRNRKLKQHLSRIRNNQSFLIGSYYFWSFKITFLIVVINLFGYFDYGLANTFFFVVPFIFIALFLESVKGLRRYWEKYTLRVMLFHAMILTSCIVTLAGVNRRTFNALNIINAKENPYVSLPEIDYDESMLLTQNNYQSRNVIQVKVLEHGDSLQYRLYRESCSIDEIIDQVLETYEHHRQWDNTIAIYAGADIPFYKMKQMEWLCAYKNIGRIYYMAVSKDIGEHVRIRKNLYVTKEMFENRTDGFPPPPFFALDWSQNIEIIPVFLDDFVINEIIDSAMVESYFYNKINKKTGFEFRIGKSLTLQQYIDFVNAYSSTIVTLRKEFAIINKEGEPSTEYPIRYSEIY